MIQVASYQNVKSEIEKKSDRETIEDFERMKEVLKKTALYRPECLN